jgi:hypothetical protein
MEKVIVPLNELVDWYIAKSPKLCPIFCGVCKDGECDARQKGDVRCIHLVTNYIMSVYPKHEGGE